MRKSRFEQTLWKSLLPVALAVVTAQAEDFGGETASSIDWKTSYRQAVDASGREGKPLLVRITATWCAPCQQMKQLTFRDSRVVDLVRSGYVALSIDADEHPELVTGFRVEAYPTTFIVAPDLTILKRMSGFQSADNLASSLMSNSKSQPQVHSVCSSSDAVSALEPINGIKYGFHGYCLVSLLEETCVRKGSPEFIAEHRGQTICFQSEEHRQKFLANPSKYWPVADGQCLVSSRDGSMGGTGDPRMAVTWRGRIWLFSDKDHQRRFIQAPHYYSSQL